MRRIRGARPDDAGDCAAIYAPIVRDTPISFEIEAPSEPEMRGRIESAVPLHPWLVCADGDDVLGYAYAGPHRARAAYRWSVDVSVYNRASHRRQGIGRGLYHALLEILTLQGFHRAYAGITLPNAASVRLHEACGFTALAVYRRVGFKCGAWHDVGWWERELAAVQEPPKEAHPFAEVASGPAVGAALSAGTALLRSER